MTVADGIKAVDAYRMGPGTLPQLRNDRDRLGCTIAAQIVVTMNHCTKRHLPGMCLTQHFPAGRKRNRCQLLFNSGTGSAREA